MPKTPVLLNDEPLQALLEEGSRFEGELCFRGTARVGGAFKGRIRGEGTLIIDSSAVVDALIKVDHLLVRGELKGQVTARISVLVDPPARFSGEVITPSLSIKEGAVFEGSSKKLNFPLTGKFPPAGE